MKEGNIYILTQITILSIYYCTLESMSLAFTNSFDMLYNIIYT